MSKMHSVSIKFINDNVCSQKCLVPQYLLKNSVLKPGDVVSIDYGSRFIICRIFFLPPTELEMSVIINDTVWFSSHKENIGCVENNQVVFPGDFSVLKVTVFEQLKIKLIVQNEQIHLSQNQHYQNIVFKFLQNLVIRKGATINCSGSKIPSMFCIHSIIIIETDLEEHICGRLSRTSSIEISEVLFEEKLNLIKNLNTEMSDFDDAKRLLNFYLFQQACQRVIVTGPSGCGKGLFVKKYCCDLRCSLVMIDGMKKFDLTTEKCNAYCEYLIQNSSKISPDNLSFLFIDHLDKLASSESKQQGTYSNYVLILQKLLKKLQHSNVYVIATSVQKNLVHPALACFFKEVFLGIPSVEQRKEILKASLKSFNSSQIHFDEVATMLPGFVASDIIQLIEKVTKRKENMNSCNELPSNNDAITTNDFEQALLSFTPSILKNSKWSLKVKPVHWNNIGGMVKIKERLQMCIEKPLSHPELFEKVGLHCPTGVLLFGPPGCCKTTLARGLATECHANFFSANPSQIYSAYVGESEKNISQLFYQARLCAPSIIFLDELDSLVGHRDLNTKQQGVAEKVLSTLLNEMDGSSIRTDLENNSDILKNTTEEGNVRYKLDSFDHFSHLVHLQLMKFNFKTRVVRRVLLSLVIIFQSIENVLEKNMKNDVIVVAATNRPDCIDNALLRPGRFDVILYVPPPNYEERISILHTVTEGMPLQEVDFKEIADKTEFFTGADLKNLCNTVAMYALRQDIDAEYIIQDYFMQALKDIQPSITKQQVHMYEKLSTKYGPVISE